MKCSICHEKVEETFLEKIKGSFVKKKPVCSNCQKKYTKEEILEKI
ncbi:MAG: hypothetical protein PHT54_03400 [Candidatus Nanoarchaeia archaeon]|nr:hypothetical protein [Candidatus Nanoarchaeia archaeon]